MFIFMCLIFLDRVLLCSTGRFWTTDPPATTGMLGLQICDTVIVLCYIYICLIFEKFFLLVCVFEAGSHIAQDSLNLPYTLNSWSSCLCFLTVTVIGMHHHTWFYVVLTSQDWKNYRPINITHEFWGIIAQQNINIASHSV